MAAAIRVLYVDDESDLLDIGKLFLMESGDFNVTTALSAPDAIRLLEKEKFDAIISDYQMPGMDGIQFLVEVRKRFGPVPFILFTGRGREEVVIQAINSGADFYLQKGGDPNAQFAELAHKIKAAASSKRADEALRKSEERYRHLIEHSNEAIVVAQDGMLKLVNHRTIDFTGYSEQELLSMQFSAFIHPDDRAMVVERYQKRLKGAEGPSRYAFRLSSKDGSTRWVELSVVVIDWDGHPATLNFLTDITERKLAETELRERQEKFAAAFSINPEPVAITDIGTGTIIEVNPAFSQWSGYSPDELIGKTTKDLNLWIDPIDRDAVLASIKAHEVVIDREVRFRVRNGTVRECLFSARLVSLGGRELLFTSARDITDRKRADEALRISEEKFRKAFFTSPDAICITRMNDGMFVSINKGFTEITGYTEEDVAGKTSLEINVWKDPEDRRKIVEELMAKGEVRNYEARFLTKTGEISGLMSTLIIELDGVPHILNITHDITERKMAEEALLKNSEELHAAYEELTASQEELRQNVSDLIRSGQALRESEKRYRLIDDASLSYIYSYDLAGRFTSASRSLCTAMMLGCDQILGRTHAELGFPDAQCRDWDDLHRKVYDTGTTVTTLTSTPMPDGTTRHYEVILNPIRDSDGTITGIAGTTRDITDRTHAEEALAESEGLLKTVVTNLHGIVFSVDKEGIFLLSEGRSLSMLGLTPGQVVGQSVFDVYKDVPEIIAGMKTALSGNPWSGICHVQGIFFDTVVTPVFDSSKMVSGAVGIATDITGRKRTDEELLRKNEELHASYEESAATGEELRQNLVELTRQEEALRESKRELADIIGFLPDATFVIDRQAIVIAWNRAMEELTGIRAEDMLGKGNYEYAIPFYGERRPILIDLVMIQDQDVLDKYSAVQKEGDSLTAETEMAYLGGKNLFLWGKAILIKNSHGEVVGAIESIRDITAWKHAEKRLVSTQEHLKEAHRLAGIGTWDWVIETDTVTWSEELCNISGWDPSLPAPTYAELPRIYTPASWERLSAAVTNALNTGEPYNLELELIRPDGSIRRTYAFGGVIRDTKGTITGLHGTVQDITERKREEDVLAESEERFRGLFDTITSGVAIYEVRNDGASGKDYIIKDFNKTALEIEGKKKDEVVGKSLFDLRPAIDDYGLIPVFQQAWKTGVPGYFPQTVYIDENYSHWYENRVFRLQSGEIVALYDDVTERKVAEEALRMSEVQFRSYVDSAPEGIFIADEKGYYIFVNDAACITTGYSREELLSKNLVDVIFPEDIPKAGEHFQRIVTTGSASGELRFITRSGDVRWWVVKGVRLSPTRFLGFTSDTTERRQVEEALRLTQSRLESSMEAGNIAWWEMDCITGNVRFNERKARMLGYPAEQFSHYSDFTKLLHPDDYGPAMQVMREHLCGNRKQYEVDYRICASNGGFLWFHDIGRISDYAPDGKPLKVTGIVIDITGRKAAEETLRNSEEYYRTIIQTTKDGFWIIDAHSGRFMDVNETYCAMSGYTKTEILDMGINDIDSVEDPVTTQNRVQRILTKGSELFETCHRRKDGCLLDVEVSVTYFPAEGGKFICFCRDITGRKRVLEALVESESFNRNLVENLPEYIAVYGMDGKLLYVNPASVRTLGYEADMLIGTHVLSYIAEEYRETVIAKLSARKEGHEVSPYEVEMVTRNGSRRSVIVRAAPIQYQDNPATLLLLIDITERRQAEEALRQLSDRLSLATRAGGVGIWDFDVVNNTLTWDDQMFALYGITKEQFGGAYEAWQAGLPPEDQQRCDEEVQMALRGEKEFDTEFCVIRPDGSTRTIRAFALVQRDAGGKPLRMIGTNWDITDRKELESEMKFHEQELMHYSKSLASANKKLTLLSGITRHDISNQLTVLMGFLAILKKKHPDIIHDEYLQKISGAAQRISSMIQFTREYEKIGVNAPVWQNCRTLADTAAKEATPGKVIVRNDLPAGTEVFADPLVVKVFFNLIDNAVRYGGKITTIRFAVEEAGDEHLMFCEDDGVGVVAGEKEKIFEQGFGKNTGLGLSLSREILNITGITIKETGEPGKGARFEITVPKGAWRIAGKIT